MSGADQRPPESKRTAQLLLTHTQQEQLTCRRTYHHNLLQKRHMFTHARAENDLSTRNFSCTRETEAQLQTPNTSGTSTSVKKQRTLHLSCQGYISASKIKRNHIFTTFSFHLPRNQPNSVCRSSSPSNHNRRDRSKPPNHFGASNTKEKLFRYTRRDLLQTFPWDASKRRVRALRE